MKCEWVFSFRKLRENIHDMKLVGLLAALAVFGMGCASTYRPQEPGRISFVLDGPGFSLYKEGTNYGAGGLSSAPVRAVAGNPVPKNTPACS